LEGIILKNRYIRLFELAENKMMTILEMDLLG